MGQARRSHHPGRAALRHGRCSIPGQVYLVTATTFARQAWFAHWPVAVAAAREIGGSRLWRDSRVHAWVLMPDHVHVLLALGESESLSHLMARAKAVTARQARGATMPAGRIWASAFHDHALRRDEQVAVAARYIITNPVRAGLAETPGQWPFWDSEWLPGLGDGDRGAFATVGRGCRRSYRR